MKPVISQLNSFSESNCLTGSTRCRRVVLEHLLIPSGMHLSNSFALRAASHAAGVRWQVVVHRCSYNQGMIANTGESSLKSPLLTHSL